MNSMLYNFILLVVMSAVCSVKKSYYQKESQLFTSTLASFKLMLVIRRMEKKNCNMPTVSERWEVINHPGLNVAIDQKNYLIITVSEDLFLKKNIA